MKKVTTILVLLIFSMSMTMGSAKLMAQPANDLIANAINLVNEPIPYNEASVNFPAATNTNDATTGSGCIVSHEGVWYKFTATNTGSVGAGIINPSGATVIFFEGPATGVTSGTQLTHVNQASNPCALGATANIQTTVGTTYYIYMRNLVVSDVIINISNAILLPPNDLIENAINLGNGPIPYTESLVNFPGATNTNDNTSAGTGCAVSQAGVWYKFTATKVGIVNAGIINPDGAVVIFFEGPATGVTSGMQLTHVNQGNNPCAANPLASIQTTIGTTYYLYMKNNIVSDVGINTSTTFQAPENDLIENAINLNGLEDYFEEDIHFLLATATNDGGQQGGCNTQNTPGIWYKFTAGTDGQVVGGLSSGPGNSAIIFFTASDENAQSGADLTWVDQPTNLCDTNNLTSIQAISGTTYYVFVGSADAYANFSINLSGILSTTENTQIEFEYYPNPVINQLHFSSKSSIDNIKIYNLIGQQVLNQNINNISGSIDMNHLSKGMYLAEITAEGKSRTFKIVKK
tara:strand:- start:24548 stop:26104 length:1557 start_codon:yes stop_codon:yes gene_type:complete